eukprot:1151460-Pelagomonas_calceolata.AAC.1
MKKGQLPYFYTAPAAGAPWLHGSCSQLSAPEANKMHVLLGLVAATFSCSPRGNQNMCVIDYSGPEILLPVPIYTITHTKRHCHHHHHHHQQQQTSPVLVCTAPWAPVDDPQGSGLAQFWHPLWPPGLGPSALPTLSGSAKCGIACPAIKSSKGRMTGKALASNMAVRPWPKRTAAAERFSQVRHCMSCNQEQLGEKDREGFGTQYGCQALAQAHCRR